MLHPLLNQQLRELGLTDPDTPPSPDTWKRLLNELNHTYEQANWNIQYRALFDQTLDGVIIFGLDTLCIDINPRACAMFGYTRDEAIGVPLQDFIAASEHDNSRVVWDAITSGQAVAPFERVARHKDGSPFMVETSAQLVRDVQGEPLYVQAVIRDITHRKSVEAAVKASEERYRLLVNHLPNVVVIMFDHDLRYLLVEGQALARHGYSRETMIGKTLRESVSPEDVSQFLPQYEAALAGREVRFELERDGYHYVTHFVPVQDDQGKVVAGMIVIEDVTSHREAEAAIRAQAAIVDHIGDAIISVDLEQKVQSWNSAAERLYGYTAEEVRGQRLGDFLGSEMSPERVQEARQILQAQGYWEGEVVHHHRDGRRLDILSSVVLVTYHDGEPIGMIGLNRDITEQRQGEEAMRFRATLVDHIDDAVYSTDLEERILSWNPAAERMYGWTAEEAMGQFSGKMVGSHMTQEERTTAVHQIRTQGRWQGEIIHTHRDGTLVYAWVSTTLMINAEGQPSGFIAISRNITQRKREQEALRESEERYRFLYEAAERQAQELQVMHEIRTVISNELDLKSLIPTIVQTIAQKFGYTHVSLYLLERGQFRLQYQVGYGTTVIEEIPAGAGVLWRTVQSGEPCLIRDPSTIPDFLFAVPGITSEIAVPLFDQGEVAGVFNIETTGQPELTENDLRMMVGLGYHLSMAIERARLHTGLREVKEQYQTVLDSIHEVVFQTNIRFEWTFLNPAWTEIMGYTVEESLGKSFSQFVHPDDLFLTASLPPVSPPPTGAWRYERRYLTKSGQTVWFEVHVRSVFDEDGKVSGLVGTLTDITERKQAENALRESEMRLRLIAENISDMIFMTDRKSVVEYVSSSLYHLLGYRVDEWIGLRPYQFLRHMHPDDLEAFKASFEGDVLINKTLRQEYRVQHADGHYVNMEAISTPLLDQQGTVTGRLAIVRDVTERKIAEQQAAELAAQVKLVESLRRFLNNISHDLRTPLSIMSTNVYLLRRKSGEDSPYTRNLNVLDSQIIHLAQMVDDMVEVSRLEDRMVEFEFMPVRLGDLTRDVLVGQAGALENRGLTLRFETDPDLPIIQADQGWMGRVVRHLITNAIQYTPEGGQITVRLYQENGGVALYVSDTGVGIAPEHLPYIFEHFYRADESRPSDKGGAGLGLTIVRMVVVAHGGEVSVQSQAGQGTTFRVWLPGE